jgi:adenylosuccinate lyase
LDALINQPIEFTGDAREQITRVVSRINTITSANPVAAKYKPSAIR